MSEAFQAFQWRLIGPHRGGRVVAVAGHPTREMTFYFGGAAGGVFRSDDAGGTWVNVSDGYFRTAPVGALAIAPSDPNVIYAGMGEACIRGNVSHGDGVYRSLDGGDTWEHLGLADTRHIGRVRVHPTDPDVVYVAALGHAFGPNPERGVYRSRDGGRTFDRVLFRDEKTGAIDLAMDPNNPRILYAALWEAGRTPWSLTSGGPGSGLFKSVDGGDTWTELTDAPGLPKGVKGRMGIAVAYRNSDRLYLSLEADEGGIFRSDDGGRHWTKTNEDRNLRQRAWYYSHIFADPSSDDALYVLNVQFWRSQDAGKTFTQLPTPHGDNHDLWIDPKRPERMITGNDGGAAVSLDRARHWSSILNQPTAQFYHVTTDNQDPYRVYGCQQDNSSLTVPSRTRGSGITSRDWYQVGGGESGYIAVHPENPNLVYAGNYSLATRYDHATGITTDITPWPELTIGWAAKDLRYRFQWTFPLMLSPHDPNTLYAAAQVVFRSRDQGQHWEVISPDLSRNDPSTMEASGGPITKDNTAVEYYGTVFALAESPVTPGLLWAGSDDGLIHLSRDHGGHWENVTPPDLPKWALISIIEPSAHDAATAYVAATRYKMDDFHPYLYVTRDYGAHWDRIDDGIPADEFTRVIREDPERAGLLLCGTEQGLYASLDAGRHWQSFRQNLPVVPIHDLVFKGDDVVVATHGRSFWILDDVSRLRAMADQPDLLERAAAIVPGRTTRIGMPGGRGGWRGTEGEYGYLHAEGYLAQWVRQRDPVTDEPRVVALDAGENPPAGAIITYYLKEAPKDDTPVTLTITAPDGSTIVTLTSAEPNPKAEGPRLPRLSARQGTNTVVWNMRYPGAKPLAGAVMWGGAPQGPVCTPGRYGLTLKVGSEEASGTLVLEADPGLPATSADLEARFKLLVEVRDTLTGVHELIIAARAARDQVKAWVERAEGTPAHETLTKKADAVSTAATELEEALIQTKAKSSQDVLNFPVRLNAKLARIAGVIESAPGAPPQQAVDTFRELQAAAMDAHAAWDRLERGVLEEFRQELSSAGVPLIKVAAPSAAGPGRTD
jgi:photosystem II stability/assembly factor-like uncharacterized protein